MSGGVDMATGTPHAGDCGGTLCPHCSHCQHSIGVTCSCDVDGCGCWMVPDLPPPPTPTDADLTLLREWSNGGAVSSERLAAAAERVAAWARQ